MFHQDHIVLHRKDFYGNVLQIFKKFRESSELFDVKIVCPDSNGKVLQAHKVIISAMSSVFKEMLSPYVARQSGQISCIFLNGVSYEEAQCILDFIYEGEALVRKDRLTRFLSLAENLKIEGLSSENELPNRNNTYKEKENCQAGNTSAVHDTAYLNSVFLAPESTTPLLSPQFDLQLRDSCGPQLEASRGKALNLCENITPSILPSTYVANRNTEITCHIPPDILHCKPNDSMTIKNEFPDQNSSSTFTCNDEKITLEEESTAESKVTVQISKKREKTSIVWKYFKPTSSRLTFICTLCERKVNANDKWQCNGIRNRKLWTHLRSHHVVQYNQHKNIQGKEK